MRFIKKNSSCAELETWKRRNPQKKRYEDLDPPIRQAIRNALREEQYGLCAFCCNRLKASEGRNAHLKSRSQYPSKALSWDNLVVSCERRDSCDIEQGKKSLPLTPLMPNCETDIVYYISGEIEGKNKDAQDTIDILGLNNRKLVNSRKFGINTLASAHSLDPVEDIAYLSDEEKEAFLKILDEVDEEGCLPSYQPALKYIVKMFISNK